MSPDTDEEPIENDDRGKGTNKDKYKELDDKFKDLDFSKMIQKAN